MKSMLQAHRVHPQMLRRGAQAVPVPPLPREVPRSVGGLALAHGIDCRVCERVRGVVRWYERMYADDDDDGERFWRVML